MSRAASSADSRPAPPQPGFGFARRQGVVLTGWTDDGRARIAVRKPGDWEAVQELRRRLGAAVTLDQMEAEAFDVLLQQLYQGGEAGLAEISGISNDMDLDRSAHDLAEPRDLLESEDDAPVIRLLNALLAEAVKAGASDIHIEPFESRLSVRFRIDGELQEVLSPHRSLAPLLVSRIKVMSSLDIAEKRLPQDGRIGLRIGGRPVDVRVSTLPSNHGERVVMRLLDKQAGRLDLGQLGMTDDEQALLDELIHRPHGIVLVTGPTGSGKTTTLYAALNRINDRSRNIMTVEDPIEYDLDGIGQTQVNSKVELSFARGLRAILRQDPDVVMVGEIRDVETARIAVQASLTGHLVLSTLHTNSAIGAVTRLRDMGVEPFLLSSSLIGVLAQRLVRRLDPQTARAYTASKAELAAMGRDVDETLTLYRPGPEAGYRGRTGVFELISIGEELRQLIHEEAGEARLEAAARDHTPSLFQAAIAKCVSGKTSLEEALRVAPDRGR